jgi:hypothetical protein
MAMRYPGGFISSTAPTVSANSAKGVWTLEEAMQYIRAGQWPVATGNGDPYFQYNTMLLPGQGTNGAQNNTFLDSSTNNFTVARNGNTTQGTFTPFSGTAGNWSVNYGANNYWQAPASTNWDIFGVDFTVEMWVYLTSFTTDVNQGVFMIGNYTGGNGWNIGASSSASPIFNLTYWNGGGATIVNSTGVIPLNAWTHLALTRSGSTLFFYLNGKSVGTVAAPSIGAGSTLTSGAYTPNLSFPSWVYGSISNLRIIKGTALYSGTGGFTPPTSPLTAVANTVFLGNQSNRFVDNGPNAVTITVTGAPAVTPFQPFGAPTVAYSASTIGGSGYFDGSGDYLNVASNAAFAFGTGDFTFETFAYYNALTPADAVAMLNWTGVTWSPNYWSLHLTHQSYPSKVTFWFHNYSSTVPILTSTTTMTVGQWYHVAVSRSGNTFKLFINGVVEATVTSSASLDGGTNSPIYIGGSLGTTQPFNGYLSSPRLVKGTAVYTAAFTPPTAPLTAISGTSLLLSGTNAGIIDNAQDNNLETVGNAQISTTQYKWGASSMYFDGTSDYLTMINQGSIFSFGTGDFTIEAWVYLNVMPSGNGYPASYWIVGGGPASGTLGFDIAIGSTNLQVGISTFASLNINAAHGMTTSTWYHVAVVRAGSTLKAFINGNTLATASVSGVTADPCLTGLAVSAAEPVGSTGGNFNGYIQDLRITKGYARYPYNFTAPTAAFPLFYQPAATPSSDPYFEYTTLLLPGNGTNGAQNNTFLDSSTNNFSITRNGNTTQGTFTPFSQTGWSNYFNGANSDAIQIANNAAFDFGTADVTIETWVYLTSTSSIQNLIDCGPTGGTGFTSWGIDITASGFIRINTSVSGNAQSLEATSNQLVPNQWNHIAFTRSSGTNRLFVNGVLCTATGTFTQAINSGGNTVTIGRGRYSGFERPATGFFSNVRITKAGALYTAAFTPSTTPLTTTVSAGTVSLLTCQSNRFVDNSANAFAITTAATPTVQAFSPFNPTAAYSTSTVGGSGYFDGTGDYLTAPADNAFGFGTGDFKIEMWIYPTAIASGDVGLWYVDQTGGLVTAFVSTTGYLAIGTRLTSYDLTSSYKPALNTWTHVVFSRVSGTGYIFANGTQVATGSLSSKNYLTSVSGLAVTAGNFGNNPAGSAYFQGYISGLVVVKGSGVTSVTVPTAPPSPTGTNLCLNYTNGGIIDNTAKNNLETVGNASISTTQSKFGGSSMFFDGTGDYLKGNAFTAGLTGSADFTIEGWIYISSLPGAEASICSTVESSGTGIIFGLGSGGNVNKLQIAIGNTSVANPTVVDSATFTTGAWVHFAAVRYSGTIYLFKNGVSVGTPTSASGTLDRQTVTVGAWPSGASTLTGYINDLRITRGIARYTQSFTPPTTAFLTL